MSLVFVSSFFSSFPSGLSSLFLVSCFRGRVFPGGRSLCSLPWPHLWSFGLLWCVMCGMAMDQAHEFVVRDFPERTRNSENEFFFDCRPPLEATRFSDWKDMGSKTQSVAWASSLGLDFWIQIAGPAPPARMFIAFHWLFGVGNQGIRLSLGKVCCSPSDFFLPRKLTLRVQESCEVRAVSERRVFIW